MGQKYSIPTGGSLEVDIVMQREEIWYNNRLPCSRAVFIFLPVAIYGLPVITIGVSLDKVCMFKLFLLLIFMVLILPLLGLLSMDFFFQWLLGSEEDWEGVERLECLLLPNQGAFFVNYIINSAFVRKGTNLIRFPDVFYFVWNMVTAKSAGERNTIRKESPTGKESKSEEVRYQWNESTPSRKDYVVIDIEDETPG
ncbi:CSC1-like protein 1 [Pelobates fuscus]|uniref:CSC1-like protein 1 n=1 Tax=Pelobates fuscus TaxID=191477 RepID=UPI002FE4862D